MSRIYIAVAIWLYHRGAKRPKMTRIRLRSPSGISWDSNQHMGVVVICIECTYFITYGRDAPARATYHSFIDFRQAPRIHTHCRTRNQNRAASHHQRTN